MPKCDFCGGFVSGRERIVECPHCGSEVLMVAEAPSEPGRAAPADSRKKPEATKPRLRRPDSAVLRYTSEEEQEREDDFRERIERLKNIGRR